MLPIIYALIPVILIILLGVLLKRIKLFSDESWTGIENLCYFILFPALLVKTLATTRIAAAEALFFSAMMLFAIFAMSAIMLLLRTLLQRRFGITPASFTSLFQGATRWHGFMALSIAGLLFGDDGVTYIAIIMAVIIPPLNIINVALLAGLAGEQKRIRQVVYRILVNPFILACAVGAALNLSGIGLPAPLYSVFDIIGGGALGLALIAVGAGLRFRLAFDHVHLVAFGSAMRLLGMPLLMFLGAWIFDIEGVARSVAIISAAVPTASSSYVLARQMGGDAPLMANLITFQVLAAAVTLPGMIWLAGGL